MTAYCSKPLSFGVLCYRIIEEIELTLVALEGLLQAQLWVLCMTPRETDLVGCLEAGSHLILVPGNSSWGRSQSCQRCCY